MPLDLPPARGGLPVPVGIVYGAKGAGAAGLGWDVPLAYVRYTTTSIAGRRPALLPSLSAREQLTVALPGRTLDMVRRGDVWIARRDAPDVTLSEQSDGSWILTDASARSYRFGRLAVPGLWLLDVITAKGGGGHVELEYEVAATTFPTGSGTAIDLTRVRYNPHPTAGCMKHEIVLSYGPASAAPLALEMIEDAALVRHRVLAGVDVTARADCGTEPEAIRRYALAYQDDLDTLQPRLRSVTMRGRRGLPDGDAPLTVATYGYGTATRQDNLRYVKNAAMVASPPDAEPETASTRLDPTVDMPGDQHPYTTWQNLIDVTGDWRADLVYRKDDDLMVAVNAPGGGGTAVLVPMGPLHDVDLDGPLGVNASQHLRYKYGAEHNVGDVWRQTIDVNGDGRLDVIDASEEPGVWVVYLNGRVDGTSTRVDWLRRSINVTRVREELEALGHILPGGHVPLSRRFTGQDGHVWQCMMSTGTSWGNYTEGFEDGRCNPNPTSPPPGLGSTEKTHVEWEVTDFNGDGHPDVVYNTSRVRMRTPNLPHPQAPGFTAAFWVQHIVEHADGLPFVAAFINVAGQRIDTGISPFAEPVDLGVGAGCGVGLWDQGQPSRRQRADSAVRLPGRER